VTARSKVFSHKDVQTLSVKLINGFVRHVARGVLMGLLGANLITTPHDWKFTEIDHDLRCTEEGW